MVASRVSSLRSSHRLTFRTSVLLAAATTMSACTAELMGPDGGPPSILGSGGQAGGLQPTGGSGDGTGGQAGVPASGDLPCEVQSLLRQSCESCHKAASPMPLVTHANLTAPSQDDPSLTMAQSAVLRMDATDQTHMPPSPVPLPPATEMDAFAAWVAAGAPIGSCSGDLPPLPPDPYDTPVVCTSASLWTGGNRESPNMKPGGACISCHTEEDEGPELTIAGTLYPTAHEPDDCNGAGRESGATVVITDAAGRVFELELETSGNFMLEDPDAFTFPYTAKVVSDGGERVMVSEQESGDCNECHTEGGTEDAPGRIMLP